jgi:hypothetical protein
MGERAPAGLELQVEVRWCPECHADCTVQIVQLSGDPAPVAVCAECGAGIALWLPEDDRRRPASRRGAA